MTTSSVWTPVSGPSYPAPSYSLFNLQQQDGSVILKQDSGKIQIETINPLGFTKTNNQPVTIWQ